jgi:hypothetical protein
VVTKPIVATAEKAEIKNHRSPYFMRRTFQDLCRAASVHDFVARSISGHATVAMQQHYSSVNGTEVRDGLAKVISLAGFRLAQKSSAGGDRDPTDGMTTEPDAARGGDRIGVGGDEVVIRPERSLTMKVR